MPEYAQIILGIGIMLVVILLTRRFHGWKIKRALWFIIDDLKSKGAIDPQTAVYLPYAKRNVLRIGLKDHRPTALQSLVVDKIVGISEDGRYYLADRRV